MAILETAYPSYYAKRNAQQHIEAAKLYAEMFADDPANLVYSAVKAFIVGDTSGFPPSIGQIKERMHSLIAQDAMTETEAWSLVSRACSNGIYGYLTEFQKLPPNVQAVVGRPEQLKEWAMMDSETVQSVVASNFMRSYRVCAKRAKEHDLLPENVKELISGITGQTLIGEWKHEEHKEKRD